MAELSPTDPDASDLAGTSDAHLTPEALGALFEGRLDEKASHQARQHLARCPACAADLRDLESFQLPDDRAGRHLPAQVVAAAWRRLQPDLDRSPGGAHQPVAASARGASRARWQWLAAALVAVTVGLGAWNRTLRSEIQRLELEAARAWTDVPIVDLDPQRDRLRGGPQQVPRVDLGAGGATFILHLEEPDRFVRYRVELAHDASVVWRGELSARPAEPYLTLALPSRLLSAGPQVLRLFGFEGDRLLPAGTFPFIVAP